MPFSWDAKIRGALALKQRYPLPGTTLIGETRDRDGTECESSKDQGTEMRNANCK